VACLQGTVLETMHDIGQQDEEVEPTVEVSTLYFVADLKLAGHHGRDFMRWPAGLLPGRRGGASAGSCSADVARV
jgi:hypothetical protein